jgi:hypothetical protein
MRLQGATSQMAVTLVFAARGIWNLNRCGFNDVPFWHFFNSAVCVVAHSCSDVQSSLLTPLSFPLSLLWKSDLIAKGIFLNNWINASPSGEVLNHVFYRPPESFFSLSYVRVCTTILSCSRLEHLMCLVLDLGPLLQVPTHLCIAVMIPRFVWVNVFQKTDKQTRNLCVSKGFMSWSLQL